MGNIYSRSPKTSESRGLGKGLGLRTQNNRDFGSFAVEFYIQRAEIVALVGKTTSVACRGDEVHVNSNLKDDELDKKRMQRRLLKHG